MKSNRITDMNAKKRADIQKKYDTLSSCVEHSFYAWREVCREYFYKKEISEADYDIMVSAGDRAWGSVAKYCSDVFREEANRIEAERVLI